MARRMSTVNQLSIHSAEDVRDSCRHSMAYNEMYDMLNGLLIWVTLRTCAATQAVFKAVVFSFAVLLARSPPCSVAVQVQRQF